MRLTILQLNKDQVSINFECLKRTCILNIDIVDKTIYFILVLDERQHWKILTGNQMF